MSIQSGLRHALRAIGQRFPQLRRHSGRLGLGRLLTRGAVLEQVRVDGDVVIELDLSVPQFRFYYFNLNLSTAHESVLVRRLLTPNDLYVDVGAHIGYFALVAAKYARHVLAFEPSPETYARLQRNIQLNPTLAPKITTFLLGLSDQPGSASFFYLAQEPGGSSLRPVDGAPTRQVPVTLETLDRMLADHRATFIKIDVEGAELDVLNGGRTIIVRDHPLFLCEFNETAQKRFGRSCAELLAFFQTFGYVGYLVKEDVRTHGKVLVTPLDSDGIIRAQIYNGLFVPTTRAPEILARLTN